MVVLERTHIDIDTLLLVTRIKLRSDVHSFMSTAIAVKPYYWRRSTSE